MVDGVHPGRQGIAEADAAMTVAQHPHPEDVGLVHDGLDLGGREAGLKGPAPDTAGHGDLDRVGT